jgi:hypothetical protein
MYNNHNNSTASSVGAPQHRRTSRSNSVSSSSVSTLKRSASITSTTNPSQSHRPSTSATEAAKLQKKPAALTKRRRSSVAHVALDGIAGVREGVGNLNRWSQSTASSKSSVKEAVRTNYSRAIAGSTTSLPANGSAVASPPRKYPKGSPPPSPRRRPRPSSPSYNPAETLTAVPSLASLPLLSAKVYDPSARSVTPSSTGAYTPGTLSSINSDYFNSNSRTTEIPGSGTSSPGRARQPLRTPPIAATEAGPKTHKTSRSISSNLATSTQNSGRLDSRNRTGGSRDIDTHNRTDSEGSGYRREEEGGTATPPRQRERREKDKKTMLSRALQKANTAVLLDNASNFEGAIEAYSDACRLLQQVLIRSSGEEDKRKLEAIVSCYTASQTDVPMLTQCYSALRIRTGLKSFGSLKQLIKLGKVHLGLRVNHYQPAL